MDARVHALLRQAAEWRLIGLLFECPAGTWRDDIGDLLLGSAVTHALEEASEGLCHSTFGPGGPAPPREVTYVKAVQHRPRSSERICSSMAASLAGGSLAYDLLDTSPSNIKALVENPLIRDTNDIERNTFVVPFDVEYGDEWMWIAHRLSGLRDAQVRIVHPRAGDDGGRRTGSRRRPRLARRA